MRYRVEQKQEDKNMDKTAIDIMHDAMILIDVAAENIRGNEKYVSLLDMALEKLTDAEKIINRI